MNLLMPAILKQYFSPPKCHG